ncbi:hypothetical protein [Saccharibacillus sacchari]|uniref:Uncharacterized protein n=1 Tax=Saccharibacillus sacchari TaxID=456493 RepID=A0ACC6PII1_9BACL
MFDLKTMLRRFTDVYNKDPNSNIGLLISILHGQLASVLATFERTREWKSIDAAEGVGLDRIGENVVQPRGASTDEVYRVLLKSKVARNLSTSDIDTIIRVLALALDADPSEVKIRPKWADKDDPEPAALSLIKVPIRRLNEVGMSPFQFAQIIQQTVAAGVRVAQIELAGTFRLSPKYAEVVKGTNGLADDEMTRGGRLGEVYVPGDDYALPIN